MRLNDMVHAGFVFGYRTVPEVHLVTIGYNGLQVTEHTETYWSHTPILYYSWQHGDHATSNLVEARFNRSDPAYGGFGDGQPFYVYLTHANVQQTPSIIANLPGPLRSSVDQLRFQIVNDPAYEADWTFAGILPLQYKRRAIELFRAARKYTEHKPVSAEFNYIGSVQLAAVAESAESAIVGVFNLVLRAAAEPPKLRNVLKATALYQHQDSCLAAHLPLL